MKRTPSTASPKREEKEDDAGVVSAVLSAEEEAELAALQAREARGGAEALASELGAALQAQERALVEAIIERSQEVQQLQDQLSQIPVILAPLHQQLAEHQAQLKALALKAHEADIRADKRLLLAQNLQRLSDQLADLLQRLDLPQSIRQTLESGGLEMEKDLESAWGAVEALEAKEKSLRELPPAMLQMKAVSDHLECIAQLRTNFASRLQVRIDDKTARLNTAPSMHTHTTRLW
jgi:predicted RNase H-like nuclease (RuvC/YqgF family)